MSNWVAFFCAAAASPLCLFLVLVTGANRAVRPEVAAPTHEGQHCVEESGSGATDVEATDVESRKGRRRAHPPMV